VRALAELITWFFRDGIENPRANQQLLNLFPDRFDLCADFKRLYIYKCKFNGNPGSDDYPNDFLREAEKVVRERGLPSDIDRASCVEHLS
jgi:hypothetical protein